MGKAFDEYASEIEEYSNVMIVDGLNLAFRFKHANKKNYAIDFLSLIQSLARSYEAKHVIVLGDGGSTYRKNICSEYKANRVALRAKQTQEEAEEFEEFIQDFDKSLDLIRVTTDYFVHKLPGVEADDIAAYLVTQLEHNADHIWLISSDKDWDLLVAHNVSRFSYRTRKEITLENWDMHYTYGRDMHISIKVLMGDKGDNVAGVDGIGEKRAYAILRDYGPTALDVYDAIPLPGKQVFIQNLNAFGDKILQNYELMDLRTYCKDALLDNVQEIDNTIGKILNEQN